MQQVSLNGQVSHTLYREESYATTCTREEPYTDYQTRCDTRIVQHCDQGPNNGGPGRGGPGRDGPRGPGGERHDRDSRLSTNVFFPAPAGMNAFAAGSEQSVQGCYETRENVNCRQEPYTAYRTVSFSCIKTHTVAYGTEVDQILSASVTVKLVGDIRGLTGRDSVLISVANGNDIHRSDISIDSVSAGDTHFLKLTQVLNSDFPGDKREHITANYQLEAIPVAPYLSRKTVITDLDANRAGVILSTTGQPVSDASVLNIISKKDQVIGGFKTDLERTLPGMLIQATSMSGGERISTPFGSCVNSRPHEVKVVLSTDPNKMILGNILNQTTVVKVRQSLTSEMTKRFKFKKDSSGCNGD